MARKVQKPEQTTGKFGLDRTHPAEDAGLIPQILNSFYGRRFKSVGKLEILGALLPMQALRRKSQWFPRHGSLKDARNVLPRNTFRRAVLTLGFVGSHPTRSPASTVTSRRAEMKRGLGLRARGPRCHRALLTNKQMKRTRATSSNGLVVCQ